MRDDIVFYGIIEGQGKVVSLNMDQGNSELVIDASSFPESVMLDDSIAVNGVCLTVQSITNGIMTFNLWRTTIEITNLYLLKPGMLVNLERNRRLSSK